MTHPLDGIRTVATETKLAGATDRIDRDLEYGERIVLLVEAKVTEVAAKAGGNGPVAKRTLTALDIFEVDLERGDATLSAMRAERRRADDAHLAHAPLDLGVELEEVDGVLATPAESAALKDDADPDVAPPWSGYDEQSVGEVLEALENTSAAAGDGSVGYARLVEETRSYEAAHKGRKGILDFCDAELERQPAAGDAFDDPDTDPDDEDEVADAEVLEDPPLPGEDA